jgi:hypothetical protein
MEKRKIMENNEFYEIIARKRDEIYSMSIPDSEKQKLYSAIDNDVIRRHEICRDAALDSQEKELWGGLDKLLGILGKSGKTVSEALSAEQETVKNTGFLVKKVFQEYIPAVGESLGKIAAKSNKGIVN